MLTNEVESQKLKCHPYWNRNCDEPAEYGNMVVILMDENVSASWKIRTFTILNKKVDLIFYLKVSFFDVIFFEMARFSNGLVYFMYLDGKYACCKTSTVYVMA